MGVSLTGITVLAWGVSSLSYVLKNEDPIHIAYMAVQNPESVVLNPEAWLKESWQAYNGKFIQTDGRVKDFFTNSSTTSEGQSYAMLRAVWLNDKATFSKVWEWTRNNLQQRAGNKLLAWRWGQLPDGHSWGMLDDAAATDADQDVALALLLGYHRWNEGWMLHEAKQLLNDIWTYEVVNSVKGPVLLPGDWHRKAAVVPEYVLLNPSYFSPYAYHVFALFDKEHDWSALASTSYSLLQQQLNLSKHRLVLDWVWFNRSTGELVLQQGDFEHQEKQSTFSYEAFRAYWRMMLDELLFAGHTHTSQQVIQTGLSTLNAWSKQHNNTLPGTLTPDGKEIEPLKSKAIYGALWPVFRHYSPSLQQQLAGSYSWPDASKTDDYYAQNWFWFGMALQLIDDKAKPFANKTKEPYWALDTLTFWLLPKDPVVK